MTRILVVEDEPVITIGLQDDLEAEGYEVEAVSDGDTGSARAARGGFDLILLDVMLPGKDGFTICRELRAAGSRTPIILLTAKGQERDKVMGLGLGADDYVTKPFSPAELVARIQAVLRRAARPPIGKVFQFSDVQVDFSRHEIRRGGRTIRVTPAEMKLLRVLIENRGEVLSIDQLLSQGWGKDVYLTDRVIYTHMDKLRAKIESDPKNPRHIVNVHGAGYRFEE
jgi:two-component system alkaline phosphatase synthesis response regulator PhoP/two-component system response regulator VicR